MNKCIGQGSVFFHFKNRPKSNEYHTICCGKKGNMYGWDILEKRDNKSSIRRPEFVTSPNMKMAGIML